MGKHGTKTLCEISGESDMTNCRWELQSKLIREVQGRIGEIVREQKKTMRMIITNAHGFMDAIKNIRGNKEGTLRKIIIQV